MKKIISPKQYVAEILKDRKNQALKENAVLVKEEKAKEKEDEEVTKVMEKRLEAASLPIKYNKFITSVKEEFLGDCIYHLFNESLTVFDRLDKKQELVKKALVQNFIQEQGVDKLLIKFRKQNALLSEFALIVDNAVKQVTESTDVYNKNSWTIDKDIKDKFIDDLSNCNSKEAIVTITDRVTDAETEFINDNTRRKMEIDEILQAKKERLDSMEGKPEDVKESVALSYDRKVKVIKNRHISSVYQTIAEAMTKNALSDSDLRDIYVKEGNLNMDTLLIDTGIMYSFLETLFTSEMVDTKYITEFINNI